MSLSLIVKQAMRAPLAAASAASRPASSSLATKYYSTSTSVTETKEQVALQAEIVSGAPELVRMQPCRIYQQAKAATQSAFGNTGYWRLDFDTQLEAGRFENELMGWASSADYMQALAMKFTTKEDAIAFADKQGYDYTVQEPNQKIIKKKVYADNFKYSPKKLRFVKTK
ncbi:hypothetical protein BGX27_008901 [Mortierella sp. AM989]|nr:hypothetical protein BGX27_008901 [Mortierella sp. AM989]